MNDVTMDGYTDGTTILLLIPNRVIGEVMEDWVKRSAEADVRVRRAKTPGHTVIETKYVLYATEVVNTYAGVKVFFRKEAKR